MANNYEISKGCDGKIKHASEIAVQFYISSSDKVGIEDYYKCKYCGNFHTFTVKGKRKLSQKKQKSLARKRDKLGPRKMRNRRR